MRCWLQFIIYGMHKQKSINLFGHRQMVPTLHLLGWAPFLLWLTAALRLLQTEACHAQQTACLCGRLACSGWLQSTVWSKQLCLGIILTAIQLISEKLIQLLSWCSICIWSLFYEGLFATHVTNLALDTSISALILQLLLKWKPAPIHPDVCVFLSCENREAETVLRAWWTD